MSGFQPATGGGQKPAPQIAKPLNQPPQSEEQKPWWKFGLTTWLLIFGLVVINAGLFVKPEMLDRIVAQFWWLLGFVDVRFWPWWYWPVFWIIVIGLVSRYLLSERIEFAEVEGLDTDQLRLLQRLVTIIAVGLAIVMICVHSDLAGHLRALIGQFYAPPSPQSPWWIWPVFWVVVIAGLLVYRAITAFRGKEASAQTNASVQTTVAPKQQPPTKPKGFNTATGGKSQAGFRGGPTKERTPLLERLGLSALSEMGMIVWLIPVGLVLLAVIGYFCYQLMTMEWIDAEGYPISKPLWVWALPFAILALGALIWKVVLAIRESMEDGDFRLSRTRSASQSKPQKPKGFNVQSPGQGGFQRNNQEQGLLANPFFWVAIVGGGLLLLIIVLLLIFR